MVKAIFRFVGKLLALLVALALLLVLTSVVFNAIKKKKENELFVPLGDMVEVNGHEMHVYTEGSGDKTLVFMAGGGTSSPVLDFKTLFSKLSGDYRIAVVEKSGYGFSEISGAKRDIDTILSETRAALTEAGINGPYVLVPHSMSGIEAIYWAQQYPQEVEAIIGLDPAVPQSYEKVKMPPAFLVHVASFPSKVGLYRFIPSICNSSAAISAGELTDDEKDIYRAVYYRRTMTKDMVNEIINIKANALKVGSEKTPDVPMLFFISNADDTDTKPEVWKGNIKAFLEDAANGEYIELDCGHYVHNYEADAIATKIKAYLS